MAPPFCMQPDFESLSFSGGAYDSIEIPTPADDGYRPNEESTPPATPSAQLFMSPFEPVTPLTPPSASPSWASSKIVSETTSSNGSLCSSPVTWPFTPVPEAVKPVLIHFSEIGIKGKLPMSLPDRKQHEIDDAVRPSLKILAYSKPYQGLSTELRLIVWRSLLVSPSPVNMNGKTWRSRAELQAIFSLCKEVYREATDVFFYDNTFRIDNRHAVRKFMHCIPERAKSRIRKIEMIPGDTTPSQAGRSYTMAKLRERGIIDSFVRHIRPLANLTCCTITWPDSDNWFWDKNFVYKGYLGIFALFIELRQLPLNCKVVVPKASEEVQRTFQTIRNWPKGIPATSDDLDRLFRALQPSSHPSGRSPVRLEVEEEST